MAFDQNSIPKDLRPLNIVRNVPEDPRIAPVTSSGRPNEGFYPNPSDVGGSPGTMPAVYYQATVPDSGFIPLGFNNAVSGVTGWVQHVVPPQRQPGVIGGAAINSGSGYNYSPNFGPRVGGNASDRASDEGGDDSVSGRKVKFLCSFGGKILPRPSDGALRYVGGQTRIISVRRDINFIELVQKMADVYYIENVVIKYQLPEEDLDALVSVSCPDDLDNMMDEYERLVERSSDGSAKLRIFLFSPSELESSGSVHVGDVRDGGQRYVEAVNGIMDGFSGSCPIVRKSSIESVVSGQNSDISGTEGADSLSHGVGEVSGLPSTVGLSPKGNSGLPFEAGPRMVCVDPNQVQYADPSSAPLGIPVVKSEQEVERSVPSTVPQSLPGVSFPASSPYVQAYMDPRPETLTHANYVQRPSQMGYPGQILGPMGPVFTQQPIPAGAASQQYSPAVHMRMNPSFISMRPNAIPNVVQQPQVRLGHYPAESMVAQRVVQIPVEQGYNAHQAQEGVYNWQQLPHQQMGFSEGGLPPQQVIFSEKVPVLEDCHMCQKALPHAHSDTIAQEQKESPASTLAESRSIYHSLRLDNRGRPIIRPVVTGATAEGNISQLAGGAQPRVAGNEEREYGKVQTDGMGISQNANDKTIPRKVENPEHSKATFPQGVMMTTGFQSPYGVFVANPPQSAQANAIPHLVVQPQPQFIQDTTINRPVNNDIAAVGMPLQSKDYTARESPKEYSVVDDSTSLGFDRLREIGGRLENLRINPSEILPNNEHNQPIADTRQQESYEVTEAPPIGNPNMYPYSTLGVNHLAINDTAGVYSGVEPAITEWKDNIAWPQSKIDVESVANDGNRISALSPSYRGGDIQDNSSSLFVNQDPWNIRPDTHFPPPKPSKIQIRRENVGPKDPLSDNHLLSSGESPTVTYKDALIDTPLDDGGYQPSGNLTQDFSLEHSLSNKDSSEELIKQELQAVAEGVAASVLHSSVPSNPDLSLSSPRTQQNNEFQHANVEIEQRDNFEEIKTKMPEKINLGFPASDGIGRLQIIKNSDLEELRELGSGTFGTVYHGKWRGTDVAIKRINDRCFAAKPSEQDRMREDFWNEAIKLADLHHPNVVAFYGVVLDGPEGSIATVTEYMVNGSLRNALQKSERNLDKRKRLLIGMDVAFGMEYLHGKNIVHFDLKSDNLLVNLRDPHRPICKVGDLGLSKVKCQTLISGGVRGTLPWMAPELLNGSSSLVSEKVDVFSFGIVMWELLTGDEPYADLHYGAIIGGIVSNTLRPPVPEPCDPDWRALMERCWSAEPSERPNFTEIANELRVMAAKIPAKGQVQQPLQSANPQPKG
ncbi:hypothetical protein BUALT_Bualt16G0080300 [Buddleja alternifolia]|uniref:Protein kinase domain-containing protein n=1 Tax=Buddleja alternifolia TaxID=168488 RepID=A0AAV6WI92_9LAMI|nr:hypothetical protein BUALT_Bualt16G0080300 [Buddleja alternifolia]